MYKGSGEFCSCCSDHIIDKLCDIDVEHKKVECNVISYHSFARHGRKGKFTLVGML